jgi:hypothetical protein
VNHPSVRVNHPPKGLITPFEGRMVEKGELKKGESPFLRVNEKDRSLETKMNLKFILNFKLLE